MWNWLKSKKKKAEEVVDHTLAMFDGMTPEEIEAFNEQCERDFRASHREVTAELASKLWGSPEHRELAYRQYVLSVAITSNERAREGKVGDYMMLPEQFEKIYYREHS